MSELKPKPRIKDRAYCVCNKNQETKLN